MPMKLKQYRYPFALDRNGNYFINIEPNGKTIRHIGIQLPYRPFISYRHNSDGRRPIGDSVCVRDISINTVGLNETTEFIVNLPGILEFDNLSRSDNIKISFDLQEEILQAVAESNLDRDELIKSVLRETLVEVGYE